MRSSGYYFDHMLGPEAVFGVVKQNGSLRLIDPSSAPGSHAALLERTDGYASPAGHMLGKLLQRPGGIFRDCGSCHAPFLGGIDWATICGASRAGRVSKWLLRDPIEAIVREKF